MFPGLGNEVVKNCCTLLDKICSSVPPTLQV